MRENVWAVVVTYNRLDLLKECIEAVQSQSEKCHILIVDNASTDNTQEYCVSLCENDINISYKRMEKNIGGAGGFSRGMAYAVEHGAKYVWIMDDDTIPRPDALEKLVEAAGRIEAVDNHSFGFVSSEVLWVDGQPCKMNKQLTRQPIDAVESNLSRDYGMIPVKSATFVSLLFSAETIVECGLPIEEYFIWGDDKEYTLRVSDAHHCFKINDSVVLHKMKNNEGSNITHDDLDRIGRYFYAYRNDYCTAKRQGLEQFVVYNIAFALNMLRVIVHAKYKKPRLETMLRGRRAGRHFNPGIKYPEVYKDK